MNFYRRYAIPLNLLVIAVTIVFVGAVLVVGRAGAAPAVVVKVGSPSPAQYVATQTINVDDDAATAEARQQARLAEASVWKIDGTVLTGVRRRFAAFFDELARLSTMTVDELNLEAAKSDLQTAVDAIISVTGGEVQVQDSPKKIILVGTIPDEATRQQIRDTLAGMDQRAVDDTGLVVD
ncbi:MAG: hypothetical protein WBV06_01600, partial [Acidimicrobiia bacterium]